MLSYASFRRALGTQGMESNESLQAHTLHWMRARALILLGNMHLIGWGDFPKLGKFCKVGKSYELGKPCSLKSCEVLIDVKEPKKLQSTALLMQEDLRAWYEASVGNPVHKLVKLKDLDSPPLYCGISLYLEWYLTINIDYTVQI